MILISFGFWSSPGWSVDHLPGVVGPDTPFNSLDQTPTWPRPSIGNAINASPRLTCARSCSLFLQAGGPSCPNAVHPQRPPHLPVRSRHAVPPTTSASAALPSSTATAQLRSLSLVARSTGGHSGWGHQGFVPHQLSSCRHNSSSSGGGSGGSSSSSRNVTARVGGSSALPTPYKWSWSPEEAGDVAGPPLELDAAVLGAAGSVDVRGPGVNALGCTLLVQDMRVGDVCELVLLGLSPSVVGLCSFPRTPPVYWYAPTCQAVPCTGTDQHKTSFSHTFLIFVRDSIAFAPDAHH